MSTHVNIQEIDRSVIFLREQAERLDKLAADRGYRWAEVQAKQMRRIAQMLLDFRREQQMTGMNGARIE
jgi:hypothetical protein